MSTPARLRSLTVIPFVLLLVLAGCSSDPGPGERRGGFAGGRSKPPTPMAGQEKFFNGQLLAEVNVGTDGVPVVKPGEGGGSRGGGSGGGGRRGGGGGGGLGLRGSAGGVSGNIAGNVPFGGSGEGRGRRGGFGAEGGVGGPAAGPRMMPGGLGRPVMIHLRFTNLATEALALTIDDFVSPLGNFAVRPEKLVLEPGQTVETEPMTSQLAGQFSETDATLVLRLGAKAEKKTFTLHAVTPPGETPPAPEAPATPAK